MFPALALASELTGREHDVLMVTDPRGARLIEGDVRYEVISSTAFFGRSLTDKFRALSAYRKGKKKCARLIDEFEPHIAIGAGGYASFPLIRAARQKGVPYFLLEQNSVPGRVTRLGAKGAKEIYLGIPMVREIKGKTVLTGNVLRKSVILGERKEGSKILVLGGSGGAKRLNELGYELAGKMPEERFIILTGKRDYAEMAARPKLKNVELVEFTLHPEELYKRAKAAISRAGAIALSELLVNGIPSILVPFPYAIDDHQTHNARWATTTGAALLVPEQELERVEVVLKELLGDKERRKRMADAGRTLAPTDAAARIAERIERCLAA